MFEEFEKIEKKDWIQKANQDLKGANVFDKFDWNFGGLELKPYYDPSDNQHLAYLKAFSNREARDNDPSGEPRFWWNVQQIEVAEERLANEAALVGLQNGADGIHFAIKNTEVNLDVLLKDIEHTYCHLSFEITQAVTYKSVFNYLVNLEGSKNIHLSTSSLDENGLYDLLQSDQEGIRLITLQTELEDQPVLEITELLTQANKMIRSQLLRGLTVEKVVDSMILKVGLGTDFFIEIAKIKALRILFFQLVQAYQYEAFEPEDIHIECISSIWKNDQYGPHENMLKSSTAAFSAILGGCDSLIVLPENNTDLAQRIARNVSSVLKDESYASKVADPVAGTYYLEAAIDQLAKKSWELFKKNIHTIKVSH